jgi:hypothetical protein
MATSREVTEQFKFFPPTIMAISGLSGARGVSNLGLKLDLFSGFSGYGAHSGYSAGSGWSGFSGDVGSVEPIGTGSGYMDAGISASEQGKFKCVLKTGPKNGAGSVIYAGLKLTNTPVVATDANQAYFLFNNYIDTPNPLGISGGYWQFVQSIANVDYVYTSNVKCEASTVYELTIDFGSDGIPVPRINAKWGNVASDGFLAMTTTALKPIAGIYNYGKRPTDSLYISEITVGRNL